MGSRWPALKMRTHYGDEEMGKKNDDYPLSSSAALSSRLQPNRSWPRVPKRRSTKRWLLVLALVGVIWYSLPLLRSSHSQDFLLSHKAQSQQLPRRPPPADPPPLSKEATLSNKPYPGSPPAPGPYEGPLRYQHLAPTLRELGPPTIPGHPKTVLFAASSLKSAGVLLPIACDMEAEKRSYVHFALMSKSEIDIPDLLKLNGINPQECKITVHDCRPDFVSDSSIRRLAHAAGRALYHINAHRRPHVTIIDSSTTENDWFLRAIRQQTKASQMPLIELPEDPSKHLSWITKLDGGSLEAFDSAHIDILIQAPPQGSGNLIRLLKSLSKADFTATPVPHLTIELPPDVEVATERFLNTFVWPPHTVPNPSGARMMTLRRQVQHHKMTGQESAIRFLESFWPAGVPGQSHVLILSPQVEVSPQFFNYLKYVLLEYRYSEHAVELNELTRRLMGISLTIPSAQLNGKQPFKPPEPTSTAPSAFLWQVPDTNAVLIMGDKWTELHGFASQAIEAQGSSEPLPLLQEEVMGTDFPLWLNFAVQLTRARGYFTLYPPPEVVPEILTVHRDLALPPAGAADASMEGSAAIVERRREDMSLHRAMAGSHLNILETLPGRGRPDRLLSLPMLSWDGSPISPDDMEHAARIYTAELRTQAKCSDAAIKKTDTDWFARDLFCTPIGR